MKKIFSVFCSIIFIHSISVCQSVGLGTTTPHSSAQLHIDVGTNTGKGLLVTGLQSAPNLFPSLGGGSRMMFYPGRSAFRAGSIPGTNWDDINVGDNSVAFGYNTIAVGSVSTAFGSAASAEGTVSTAMGFATRAMGFASTAIGYQSIAGADNSLATGYQTLAVGHTSTAMGYFTTATGHSSTAMGNNTTANGNYSTALGTYVSTSGHTGAFVIGDNSTNVIMQSFVANGFRSRFAGGYRLLSNSTADIGVVLLASGNSWSAISDHRLKENFLKVDAEAMLVKIAAMPQTTWNYKAQENKTERHYGPMAQDFYAAFGKDDLGTIGCDTLINQQDFLGINLIAIQALEKRTIGLQKQNIELLEKNKLLEARLEKLEQKIASKK